MDPSIEPPSSGDGNVQFLFELASPYSYLASLRIEGLAAEAGRSVDWRPVEIETVWAAQGVFDSYAAIRAVKRSYIAQDSRRCAEAQGVSLAKPVTRAQDTLLAKLAFWGISRIDAGLGRRFIQAVWHRHFREGEPIATDRDLEAACLGLGLDAEAIATAARAPESRTSQDASNADAIAFGCFGVPWFVAETESFFGQDRLLALAACLAERRAGHHASALVRKRG